MSDYIIRGMAADKQVRFFAANTKRLSRKSKTDSQYKPYRNGCTWKIDDRNSDDGKYV